MNNSSFPTTKNELRAVAKAALLSVKCREEKELSVAKAALNYIENHGFTRIAVYMSLSNELSTDFLISELFKRKKRVFVPVVISGTEMVFTEITPDTVYAKGAFGIREPVSILPEYDFDVIFVPLVAFDENNNRLGKGKGYYDRFLRANAAKKIGLAFAEQKFPLIPTDPTDVKLDKVFYC